MTRYEEAVEGSSWAISGQCRWWASKQWVPATVELVMVGSRRSQVKDATLLLHYSLSSPAVVGPIGDVVWRCVVVMWWGGVVWWWWCRVLRWYSGGGCGGQGQLPMTNLQAPSPPSKLTYIWSAVVSPPYFKISLVVPSSLSAFPLVRFLVTHKFLLMLLYLNILPLPSLWSIHITSITPLSRRKMCELQEGVIVSSFPCRHSKVIRIHKHSITSPPSGRDLMRLHHAGGHVCGCIGGTVVGGHLSPQLPPAAQDSLLLHRDWGWGMAEPHHLRLAYFFAFMSHFTFL